MTVTELLDRILAAYPGATPEAMATFKPVFYTRFRQREGDALQLAFDEVLATFKAKYGQPFPIPADFEPHMPALRIGAPVSIKAALDARDSRWRRLFNDWHASQGQKIKAARPHPVFVACVLMAKDLCIATRDDRARIQLTMDQINLCKMQALSQSRVRMFGPLPATNDMWEHQIEQVRQAWANPQSEAA